MALFSITKQHMEKVAFDKKCLLHIVRGSDAGGCCIKPGDP